AAAAKTRVRDRVNPVRELAGDLGSPIRCRVVDADHQLVADIPQLRQNAGEFLFGIDRHHEQRKPGMIVQRMIAQSSSKQAAFLYWTSGRPYFSNSFCSFASTTSRGRVLILRAGAPT